MKVADENCEEKNEIFSIKIACLFIYKTDKTDTLTYLNECADIKYERIFSLSIHILIEIDVKPRNSLNPDYNL